MAEVAEVLLRLRTGESPKNINELTKDIRELRDVLVRADSSTEEYAEALSGLSIRHRELNNVNTATKKVIQELNQPVEKQIDNYKELRATVIQYRSQLIKLTPDSEQYKDVLLKLTSAQNELNNVNNITRNGYGDFAQVLTNTTRVAGLASAGFSSFNAVIALVGNENEAVTQSFVRLQAGIALVQGLQGLAGFNKIIPAFIASMQNATRAIRAHSAAVTAIPYVAAVTAVGVFITALSSSSRGLAENREEVEKSNIAYKAYKDTINDVERETEYYIRTLIAQGKEEAKIIQARIDSNDRLVESTIDAIGEIITNEYLLRDVLEGTSRIWDDESGKFTTRLRDITKAQQSNLEELIKNYYGFLENRRKLEEDASINNLKNQTEANKRARQDAIDAAKKTADELSRIQKQEAQDILNIQKRLRDSQNDEYEQQILDLITRNSKEIALFQKNGKDITALQEEFNRELTAINNKYASQERQKILDDIQKTQSDIITQNGLFISELEAQYAGAELSLIDSLIVGDSKSIEEARDLLDTISQQIDEARILQFERNEEFYQNYAETLQEILLEESLTADQRIEFEEQLQDALNSASQAGIDRRIAQITRETEAKQRQLDTEKKINEQRIKTLQQYSNALSTSASAAEAIAGKSTAFSKTLGIASATISTYVGAADVLKSEFGLGAKLAAFATVIGTGLGAVAKIARTEVPGDNSSSGALAIAETTPSIPNIDDYYEPTINQYEQDVNSTANRELRAYITETDVVDSATVVKNRTKINSFSTI